MVAPSRATAVAASSRLLSWCLFLLRLQMSLGFLVPAPRSPVSARVVDAATRPATASAEAGHCSDTAALLSADESAISVTRCSVALSEGYLEFVERRKAGARRVVLDLRPGAKFRKRHIEGSTSIPIDELEPRLLELPPPFGQPVSIVGNEEVRISEELRDSKAGGWAMLQKYESGGSVSLTHLKSCVHLTSSCCVPAKSSTLCTHVG